MGGTRTAQDEHKEATREGVPETGEELPSPGGDEALDGEAFGQLMMLFRRFLTSTLAICGRKG